MVIREEGTHMTRLGKMAGTAAATAALLLVATSSEAQVNRKQPTQATKLTAVAKTMPTKDTTKPHRLILQVNSNEPAMMNLALNNATNVAQYYQDLGEKVNISIVTFGPGMHMLRDDTSPVKGRIKALSESQPSISFEACGNTRENMGRAEGKEIPLISEAKVVKSGVVRVIELQEQGWSYVKP
jgi:intracellular sulfur oxidation DsrE/DsrF family protein